MAMAAAAPRPWISSGTLLRPFRPGHIQARAKSQHTWPFDRCGLAVAGTVALRWCQAGQRHSKATTTTAVAVETEDVTTKAEEDGGEAAWKYELIRSVGEECQTEAELRKLVEKKPNFVCYDGFEPSGRMHIAQGVYKSVCVNKCTKAGGQFIFWVADWFALMNDKMGGDIDKIRTVGKFHFVQFDETLIFFQVTKDPNAVCGMRSPEREPDACWKAGCEGDQVEKLRASSSTWPAPNLLAGDDGTLFGSGGLYWENYFQSEVQELRQLKWPIEFSRRKHVFKSGAVYEGEWMGSERSGLGLQVWPDGAYYKGFWKANMASGKGMFKHSNGVVYTGQWRQSQAHGLGIYHDVDGITYAGEWMDDFPGGLGEARWTDKSKYAGNFLRGARHGTGEYTWPDGSKFTGQFKNNRIDGKGTWSSITGDKYTGQWQLSLKHGLGRYELADGQVYTGHYVEGEKDGFGIFEWSNGMSYKGYWNAGHPAAVAAGTLVEAPNEGEGLKVETQLSENQLRRV